MREVAGGAVDELLSAGYTGGAVQTESARRALAYTQTVQQEEASGATLASCVGADGAVEPAGIADLVEGDAQGAVQDAG